MRSQVFLTSWEFPLLICRWLSDEHEKIRWALALRCDKFVVQQVVELLWACPLLVLYNMSVAGVRVVEFGTNDASGVHVFKALLSTASSEANRMYSELLSCTEWTTNRESWKSTSPLRSLKAYIHQDSGILLTSRDQIVENTIRSLNSKRLFKFVYIFYDSKKSIWKIDEIVTDLVENKEKGDKAPLTGGPGGPIVISASSGWSLIVSFSSFYNHPNRSQRLVGNSTAIY